MVLYFPAGAVTFLSFQTGAELWGMYGCEESFLEELALELILQEILKGSAV